MLSRSRKHAKKVAGVVLDLRGNGGGLLQDSVALAGELIDEGAIVQVRNHGGRVDVLSDPKSGTELTAPLVLGPLDRVLEVALATLDVDVWIRQVIASCRSSESESIVTTIDSRQLAAKKEQHRRASRR